MPTTILFRLMLYWKFLFSLSFIFQHVFYLYYSMLLSDAVASKSVVYTQYISHGLNCSLKVQIEIKMHKMKFTRR